MSTILAIDSTTELLSISISENSFILSELKDDKSQRHMVNIINDIDITLKKAKKDIKDIDIFSVNLGPGDFTGGRIGISVVKIFSMLSGNPIFGFNCLDIFSVGCAIKNINSIREKLNDSTHDSSVFIMPLKDVRNDEIYFSIYEVKNFISNKSSDNIIFKFEYKNTQYYIYKKFGNFLIKSEETGKKLTQVINQLVDFDNLTCSTCSKIFNEKDMAGHDYLGIKINNNNNSYNACDKNYNDNKKNDKDGNDASSVIYEVNNVVDNNETKNNLNKDEFKSKFKIIFTADAVKNYKELLQNLSPDISAIDKKINIIVDIDDDNLNPSSKYLNFLTYFNFTNKLGSLPIAPVYVRDFIVFNKK